MTEMAVDKNGRHLVGSNVIMVNNMCTGKLPMVIGDSYKITQLLYNLVTNAAKFTSAGSIQLSCREDKEPCRRVVRGMSVEVRAAVSK